MVTILLKNKGLFGNRITKFIHKSMCITPFSCNRTLKYLIFQILLYYIVEIKIIILPGNKHLKKSNNLLKSTIISINN